MDVLDDVQELGLLKFMFPEVDEIDLRFCHGKMTTTQELNL